ncbi:hypothetical protein, partial [Thermoproteus tenax]|uniref:Membrane-associated trancriptional regulator, (No HTH domain) n=1 Tax=Thermoproteus tenax (strain ATCC 35583 / DSM 2078 / JCM 9277 / NBRC 100435 / Kra 1) TaxID=768679 RepID=G4RQ59_THETK
MIILNLTIPPLLIILLHSGVYVANLSMPAPNASSIAAFAINGTPMPALVAGGRLYVLQDGSGGYVEYVPQYSNNSGLYVVQIAADEPIVVVIPPGIMIERAPGNYSLIAVNKSGTYIAVPPGAGAISYYAMAISTSPYMPSAATATSTTSPIVQSIPSTTTSPSAPTAQLPLEAALIVGALVVVGIIAALAVRRKR